MSPRKLLFIIGVAWSACVLLMLIIRTTFTAATLSPSEYFAWIFLAAGPFVVAMLIMQGVISSRSTRSMTQVIGDAERADNTSLEAVRVRLRTMNTPPPTPPAQS